MTLVSPAVGEPKCLLQGPRHHLLEPGPANSGLQAEAMPAAYICNVLLECNHSCSFTYFCGYFMAEPSGSNKAVWPAEPKFLFLTPDLECWLALVYV